MAGPQLVVPISNARFAVNAANARWRSLYDALYGSDIIKSEKVLDTEDYDKVRGRQVVDYCRDLLDNVFPLNEGSHKEVSSYVVYYKHLLAFFPNGKSSGLKSPGQFVAFDGFREYPNAIILKNNSLHIEIDINPKGKIGQDDLAGVDDILVESALTTIMDFEDSVSAVDSEDKMNIYRNWLGLMVGDINGNFEKDGKVTKRKLKREKTFNCKSVGTYTVRARALLMARNVGLLMKTDLVTDLNGEQTPEGIVDAMMTALIGSVDLKNPNRDITNSKKGSIYIVKPKMHGPEEVAFTCSLFKRIEQILELPENTIKLGIMDEEGRTSINLKACIYEARNRLVFINTGFLDRTGDEIHTSMYAGAFLPKDEIRKMPWLPAYENQNVDIGLSCGLSGIAQIGKGMWAMPDEMEKMMKEKISHPLSGATTAWVPSPTAAALHSLHYHYVDVFEQHKKMAKKKRTRPLGLLSLPIMASNHSLAFDEIEKELENNIQGILGYVVRWIDLGIGCSKVPDINNISLMEDRATLRISSQHISNWLHHKVCTVDQVLRIMKKVATFVDEQNKNTKGYCFLTNDLSSNLAFQAATDLIFNGMDHPNGYTEPVLHHYRKEVKRNILK
jgi:malate synthase